VVPALALAELLIEDGIDRRSLHYLGTKRGVENNLVPDFGLDATFLDVEGIGRRLSLESFVRNAKVVIKMWRARADAIQLFRRLSPRVVVSVGGYGSVPGCSAAKRLGIPVVTCSYDRRPGWATRRQARYAAGIGVAHLPSALPRATLTGAPVRAAIRHLDVAQARSAARERLGIPGAGVCVAVIGGSLGSRVLNDAVQTMLGMVDESTSIIHVCGDRYVSELGGPVLSQRGEGPGWYLRMGSTTKMVDMYAAADVVVARAGASTVAETATIGVASIFVPWKDAAEDHQSANARWLADEGAAVVVPEDDHVVVRIVDEVERLVTDHNLRTEIARRAYECGDLHRRSSYAALIRGVAK
jgi:UDP-N-acetylglucosamine--N-acetylmuramyl-(pentapeptide) pyrophosphoryl-undecaprenol N-acetylglucosamine transferase